MEPLLDIRKLCKNQQQRLAYFEEKVSQEKELMKRVDNHDEQVKACQEKQTEIQLMLKEFLL